MDVRVSHEQLIGRHDHVLLDVFAYIEADHQLLVWYEGRDLPVVFDDFIVLDELN